jgi:hypothetical protein
VTNPDNRNFLKLIMVAVAVHRQGSGLVWEQTIEVIDRVLPQWKYPC